MHSSRTLLLVDLSYQVYRAAAAHPMLTSRRTFTGGLYGFFTTVAKMIRDTKATEVVFCQDLKPYKRSETYPQYKQLRKKDADEELLMMFTQSMSLVLDAIRATGLPIWGVRGFEFDDLVAHAAIRYRHRFDTIWGGTNDSDVYQLFWCHNFKVYRKSLADVMDAPAFREALQDDA
jgi:5'-3' exonuclease